MSPHHQIFYFKKVIGPSSDLTSKFGFLEHLSNGMKVFSLVYIPFLFLRPFNFTGSYSGASKIAVDVFPFTVVIMNVICEAVGIVSRFGQMPRYKVHSPFSCKSYKDSINFIDFNSLEGL